MKKDEIYVLNQPKHIIQSIILVDSNTFPISDKIHENLSKLNEISDIIFVFSETHFPEQEKIIKRKFSSLYQASAYINSSGKILGNTIFKTLLYSREVFDLHISYTISLLSDLEKVNNSDFEGLVKITGSSILKPVYKERKLTASELYDNYKTPEYKIRTNNFKSFIKWYLFNEDNVELPNDYFNRMYSIWSTESPFMFYRTGTIKLLCDKYLNDVEFQNQIELFDENNPKYLFASITRSMGIEVLNLNIEDVKI